MSDTNDVNETSENGSEGAFEDLFRQLEDKIQAAADEIGRLRDENRRLTEEVETLRDAAEASGAEESGWETERQEIRGRVERIRDRLEELLAGDD